MGAEFKGTVFNEFVGRMSPLIPKISQFRIKVLCGFKYDHGAGTYVEWVLRTVYGLKFDYIIDDDVISYQGEIYRRNLLDYLDSSETVIVSATDSDLGSLEKRGYQKGRNWFDMREWFELDNIGYFEFMESKYGADIIGRETAADVNAVCKDAMKYGVSRGMSMPSVCQYFAENYPDRKILDIGCGKGGVLMAFQDFGYQTVDGIEIMDELCVTERENIRKAGYNSHIICTGAGQFQDYEKYDLYFLYDSFRGETLEKTVALIEKSIYENPRNVLFAYAEPWEHAAIIKNGVFQLVDQLKGDWFTKMLNVYEAGISYDHSK